MAIALAAAQRLQLPGVPNSALPSFVPPFGMGSPPPGPASNSPYLMCMNAPAYLGETEVKRLLCPFGKLKGFNLLKDSSGKSRGSFVFHYEDKEVTSDALKNLNDLSLGLVKVSLFKWCYDSFF
jgi:hypothetical protein